MTATVAHPSPWAPLKSKVFSALWVSGIFSTIGVRMHEVGAGWMMASLTDDPLSVALIQTATTLPIFLFALLAGAVADVVSRRKLLIVVQIMMAIIASIMAYIAYINAMTPLLLLIFVFLLGVGAAFVAPAKQAIVPQLIPREDLQSAIALNSVGFNLSRAIGPAIAGIVITSVGIYATFAFNAISFIIIIAALLLWCPFKIIGDLPQEHIPGAIATGLRYVKYSSPLKSTLWKAFAFFISASAYWALLPLFVKTELKGGAELFGLVVGMIGLGAVIGAILLPRVKSLLSPQQLVVTATLLIMGVFVVAALIVIEVFVLIISVIFGACWIWIISTFNVSAQLALPDWVRARGLAIYLMVFFGAMSFGSAIWGYLASYIGICDTIFVAGVTLGMGLVLTRKLELNQGKVFDFSPSSHWPEPIVSMDIDTDKAMMNERSPVMVTIEYHIDKKDKDEFLPLIYQLGRIRRQYGAYTWNILQKSDQADIYIEQFMDVSWLEHLRHRQRLNAKDHELEQQIHKLHQGDDPPKTSHFLGL